MSRLQELIDELCPDGVEYKALGELGTSQKGVRVVRKQLEENGSFPVYQNSLMPLGYYEESNRAAGMPFVIGAGAAAQIGYSDVEWWAADDCFTFDIPQDAAVGRFVYYCLLNQQVFLKSRVRKASIPRLARSVVEKLRIPVPPIEVQREVVRILDEYTAAHDELVSRLEEEASLRTASLTALCDHEISRSEYERRPIHEVGQLERGRRFTAADYVEDGIPSIHYGEIYTSYGLSATKTVSMVRSDMAARLRYAHPGDVVIACTGENKDDICKAVAWLGDADAAVHDDCQILHHDSDPRYIAYALMTSEFHDQKVRVTSESKVVRVNSKKLGALKIPLPPLDVQRIIADRLDEAFISIGNLILSLDKERLVLEQQYNLVRNLLLSFPEKAAQL